MWAPDLWTWDTLMSTESRKPVGPLWIITKPDKNPPLDKVNLRGHLFGQGIRIRVSKKDGKTLVFPLPLGSQGALRQKNMGEEEMERRGKGRKQKRRKERRELKGWFQTLWVTQRMFPLTPDCPSGASSSWQALMHTESSVMLKKYCISVFNYVYKEGLCVGIHLWVLMASETREKEGDNLFD